MGGTLTISICGAGSTGRGLAARLSASGARVRLIELWGPDYDWGYGTVPQEHAHDRVLYWPRGKTLNGMIHVHGNASNYDQWADEFSCTRLDYASVLPCFKKSDDFSRGEDAGHGAGSPLHVTADYEPHPVAKTIVEAAQQAG